MVQCYIIELKAMTHAPVSKAWKRCSILLGLTVGGLLLAISERHRWHQRVSPLWVRTIHDIPYGPHLENRLDILQRRWSAHSTDRPAVIIFHGGGWTAGSREDMLVRVCHRYLEHGFVVANVEYRKGAIAAAVEDAVLALQWFSRHTADYGASRNRIVVTGESAGAHLALMAAFQSGERIAAIVNFYGVTDLVPLAGRPQIRAVLPPGDPETAAKALSPVNHIRRGLPPVFSIHGTEDEVVPIGQTTQLTRGIMQIGEEAFERYIAGGGHGFSKGQQETAYAAIFEFLERRGILNQ